MNRFECLVFIFAVAALALFSTGCEEKTRDAAAPEAPEEAGWELVFSDDFDRDELGDDWEIVEGSWEMRDGSLRGRGTVMSSRGFPGPGEGGFQRVEFEAAPDVEKPIMLPGAPAHPGYVGDLSSIIHAAPPESTDAHVWQTGYFFQFGGQFNSLNRILRDGEELVQDSDPETRIEPDKLHRIAVENDEGLLRFFIDGELMYEYAEDRSIAGPGHDRVGFYFYTDAKLKNVRVYVKRMPVYWD